jgi:hypothetical protein
MKRDLTILPRVAPAHAEGVAHAGAPCAAPAGACTELSPRHADLEADGWVRRFAAGPPRLEEMTQVYRDMGLMVRHEPLDDGLLADACSGCAPARAGFRVIYTREQP